jgi:hypothetical protein
MEASWGTVVAAGHRFSVDIQENSLFHLGLGLWKNLSAESLCGLLGCGGTS